MRTSQDLLHLLKCLIINFITRAMSHTNKKTLHKSSRQADTKTIMLASWKHWECFMLAVIFRHIRLQPLVKAGGTCYFFSTTNILRDIKTLKEQTKWAPFACFGYLCPPATVVLIFQKAMYKTMWLNMTMKEKHY